MYKRQASTVSVYGTALEQDLTKKNIGNIDYLHRDSPDVSKMERRLSTRTVQCDLSEMCNHVRVEVVFSRAFCLVTFYFGYLLICVGLVKCMLV